MEPGHLATIFNLFISSAMDSISLALRKMPSDVERDRAKSLFNSAASLPAHTLSVSTGNATSFLGKELLT
jgi:hypothetical protein